MRIEYATRDLLRYKDLAAGDVWKFPGSEKVWMKISYCKSFDLLNCVDEDFGMDPEVIKLNCKLVIL